LKSRVGLIEGVCVSGGEPLLNDDLGGFLKRIKDLGFAVKVDTNGSMPNKLKELVEQNLIDYVAMDIKTSPKRYKEAVGVEVDIKAIKASVEFLKNCGISYEFRTTMVKDFINEDDIQEIGKWLTGAKKYYLQSFKMSESVPNKSLSGYSEKEIANFTKILEKSIQNVQIR
jgi:anaerobic ribonucleoside-triphosphate reductase activating protein